MYFAQSAPRLSPSLQPTAQQWSHTVPAMMPWADASQQFMRFQSQPAPIQGPSQQSHFIYTAPNEIHLPPAYEIAHPNHTSTEPYKSPGDPCTSKSCDPLLTSVSPPPPPYQYPSTSYCMVRSKRKMRQGVDDPVVCKQLVTEKMVEQMNGLSIGSRLNTMTTPPRYIEPRTNSINQYEEEDVQTLRLDDEVRKYVVSPTIEDHLAMEMRKKSTMAIIPWSPPKPLECFKIEENRSPNDVTDSMEM